MILAAGLGTRLRPLTNNRPKALVEVDGMPLLEIAIRRLKDAGCEGIIVNIHHFGSMIRAFLAQRDFGLPIEISDESGQLLETGGGLKKARGFLDGAQSFLMYNADILSNIDLRKFYEQHNDSGALATLSVRRRESSRYLVFDERNQLCGWTNVKTGVLKMSRAKQGVFQFLGFSGIHAIHPAIFELMPSEAAFSIIDLYLQAAHSQKIMAYPHDQDLWLDVGKPEALKKADVLLRQIME